MPGQSTLGPDGYEAGWPSIKPPGSDQPEAGQGTTAFANQAVRQAATPPHQHKKMYVPGVGDVGPVVEGAVDVVAGATAPIVRAAQGIYRAPGMLADEARRLPIGAPPTPQVRGSYESNPVEQGVGKIAASIEDFAQQHGLPVGVAKELATAAGGLAPLLLLKNPAAIGGLTAAESYGRGDSLYDALKKGAEQAGVIGVMGGGARALDEVLSTPGIYKLMQEGAAQRGAALAPGADRTAAAIGAGGRLVGRTAVNVAAPNVIRAATGEELHPITVPEAVTAGGFAIAHGVQSPSELVPEPKEAIDAQLDALKNGRGNRKAVLVPTEDQMPMSKGRIDGTRTDYNENASRYIHSCQRSKEPA